MSIVRARGAGNVRVFGSVANGADTEGSDIDLLVELPPQASLFDLAGLQLELEEALGVGVDICTEAALEPRLKERILAEARQV